jgi:hypothetical protein
VFTRIYGGRWGDSGRGGGGVGEGRRTVMGMGEGGGV